MISSEVGTTVSTSETFAHLKALLFSCQSLELYHQLFQSVTQGVVTGKCILLSLVLILIGLVALFALRVYALYGCRRAVLVIFMGIAILGTAISIWVSRIPDHVKTVC